MTWNMGVMPVPPAIMLMRDVKPGVPCER